MFFQRIKQAKDFLINNERYLSPLALVLGFLWDSLTLQRIDLWIENVIIVAYLFIAGISILILNAYQGGRLYARLFEKIVFITPFLLQFAFGGLFSAFVIFYSKSASFIASWPFILILGFLLIGNELFRERYLKFTFQVSIFFIALYSYLILAMPVLFNQIGAFVFIISGITAVLLISGFIYIIYKAIPERFKEAQVLLFTIIGIIYLVFNFLYFTNIIPPVPLALKESGIYHSIERTGNKYKLTYEPSPWYSFFQEYNDVFHWRSGERVYCYSAVFAPTDIDTKIFHRWSYWSEEKEEWVKTDRLGYFIIGGRGGGFRGYTFKSNLLEGDWRVEVITERDQVLGRIDFKIIKTDSLPELKTIFE